MTKQKGQTKDTQTSKKDKHQTQRNKKDKQANKDTNKTLTTS